MKQHIRQQPNNLLNRAELEQDLIHLYGDGFYESIDYQIDNQGDKKILAINAIEKNWRSDYFTLGFDINNEYRKDTNFDVRAAYRSTWINHYGGEFFGTADIGSNPGFEAEFYQPLNSRQTYFVQPSVYHKSEVFSVFLNQDKIAEYNLKRSYSELALGENLEFYGQAKLGWREYDMKSTSDVSAIDLGNYHDKYGGVIFDMLVDERNRLYFPSRGWSAHLSYFDSKQQDYAKLSSELNFAYPLDNFVLAGRTSYIRSTHGQLPFVDAAYLGGFLNLSAYASNQIIADNALYAHLRAERIIGRMPLGLNGDLRLGLGLEAAKLKNAFTLTSYTDSWLTSAVIYLGGETPLGPAYLGLGFSEDGKLNLYMQVGAH
jgi:NTE family protein